MIWVLLVAASLVGGFVVFLIVAADKPTYYRWRRMSFLRDYSHWFAEDLSEGSVLVMEHQGRPFLHLVQNSQGDRDEREVSLRVPIAAREGLDRDHLSGLLRESAGEMVMISWDECESTEYVETAVRGSPGEVGAQVLSLAEVVGGALGFNGRERFKFHVLGEVDVSAWRRRNQARFEEMTQSDTRLHRWFARRQLRQLAEDPRRKGDDSDFR